MAAPVGARIDADAVGPDVGLGAHAVAVDDDWAEIGLDPRKLPRIHIMSRGF